MLLLLVLQLPSSMFVSFLLLLLLLLLLLNIMCNSDPFSAVTAAAQLCTTPFSAVAVHTLCTALSSVRSPLVLLLLNVTCSSVTLCDSIFAQSQHVRFQNIAHTCVQKQDFDDHTSL